MAGFTSVIISLLSFGGARTVSKRTILLIAVLCLVAATAMMSAPPETKSYSPKQVARGKYLVVDAGTCQDCHSPRNQKGEFVQEQWMMGSPLMFKPTIPIPNWAEKSANLVGLPNWTDAQAVKFLMTGIAYNGLPARPPMPPYRFSREDATAIVAYLRSLKTAQSGSSPIKEAAKKEKEKK